jgi:hypothetical protein
VTDVRGTRWILGALLVAVVAVGVVVLASGSSDDAVGPETAPATVAPVKGTDLSQVTLSADAARRLGIRTGRIEAGTKGDVIPYDAVLYDANGETYTYTSPKPLVFVRAPIVVKRIDGADALLTSGPRAGTAVVTVGSQELYGTEHGVEED